MAITSIVHLPFHMFGKNADFTIRFSGVLFQALSVVILYLFVKELCHNAIVAFFTAIQFSFTPFYFSPNTYGKEHGMAMFLLLLSFYLLLRGTLRKSPWVLGLSSFIFLLSVSVRESMLVITPIFFLLYLASGKPDTAGFSRLKERLKPRLMLSLLLPFVCIFLFLYFGFIKNLILAEVINKDSAYICYLGFFSSGLLRAMRGLFLSVPPAIFLFAVVGALLLYLKKEIFLTTFLLLWFAVMFYFANMNIFAARYLDVVIIPVYILCSLTLCAVYKRSKAISILLVSYFIFSMFIFMYPMLKFRHRFNGEKRFAFYVKYNTPKNALIIAADDGPFINYYGSRQVLSRPLYSSDKINDFIKGIKGYLKDGKPVYVIQSALGHNSDDMFNDVLARSFVVKEAGWYLNEDYHFPELGFHFYFEKLFRIALKDA